MGTPTTRVSPVHVAGPLAPFAAAFQSRLGELGYTPLTTASQLRVMANLSGWLETGAMTVSDLTRARVEEFLEARRAAGYVAPGSRRCLATLLEVVGGPSTRPTEPTAAAGTATDDLLRSFQRYLLQERALAPSTTAAYVDRAGRFLSRHAPEGDLTDLTATDITGAVLGELTTGSVGAAQYFVAALRSFLRFCFVEGQVATDLAAAALSVTGRRQSSLPQGIGRSRADALLRSCDRRRAQGRRDYAALLTLLRLGLRATEVAQLTLEDLDWRAAELVVHGKGRRDDRLPLPADVGEAVAGYLRRGRPASPWRQVFLRALAPIGPLGRGGISMIVRSACVRAGVPSVGAHRLRHTLACEMIGAGVGLAEIGQVLRHRSLVSTATYARVDLQRLRALAQPWPGGIGR